MVIDFPISTSRLILRPIRLDDAELLFGYRSDKIVNQFQGWIPETLDDARDFITNKVSSEINVPDTWFQLVIIEKESYKLIGDIGIHFLTTESFHAEIGCTLDKSYQNKGYATEALTATIDFLFSKLNMRRIIASIDPRNEMSLRLVERLKFKKEAHLKKSAFINNEWVDDLIYVLDCPSHCRFACRE